jgi:cystathionine beta-lyase
MESSEFDTPIDRRGTWSLKWDNPKNRPGLPDILPLWVADMDFAAPPAVLRAIRERAGHPVFGYTNPPASYVRLLVGWYRQRYGLELPAEAFLPGPAVMPSIAIAIRTLVGPDESVIINPPVYYPFFEVVRSNGRHLIEVPLLNPGPGRWELDFGGLEAAVGRAAAAGQPVRALLLSSPHNPGGRVWTRAELERLDALSERHGVFILSDEIHSDIVFAPSRHVSLADGAFRNPRRVVFAGPNKTFNIAGLHLCHLIAPDAAVRQQLARALAAAGHSQPNVFSITAAHAAYADCGPWVDGLKDYLSGNFNFLTDFLASRLPEISGYHPEGTYLAWLDARPLIRRLGLKGDQELALRLEEDARVKLSHGTIFGPAAGAGFLRLNVACPRSQLAEGLQRIAAYLDAPAGGGV